MWRATALWTCVLMAACGQSTVTFHDPCGGRLTKKLVERVPRARADALDLLLVVDDSGSMPDKQQLLADALPELIAELTAHEPVIDMHVGIITTSLGGHGSDYCDFPDENDRAHLLTHDGTQPFPTYEDLGFLFWDPTGEAGGDSDAATFTDKLATMILAAGDRGCGFEAPLEAWYRFLIEPAPHASITMENGQAVLEGIDDLLLAQRRDFLRPDSLLAVVMLTDENDCSIRDGGQYFYALQLTQPGGTAPYHLPKPRAACAVDPNDPCCRSCGQPPGEGCSEALDDCDEPLSPSDDPHHLRCFDQKRRFGIDFTWPIERYVAGLSELQVTDRHGNVADNPLFVDLDPSDADHAVRDPSLVFLAGIVGVPWQDLARRGDDGLPDANAGLMTATEMQAHDTWDLIVGDPSCYHTEPSCRPTDPLMRESVEPRTGVHPITGDPLVPPGGSPPLNPINGHERVLFDELQYACIMPLPEPRDCTAVPSSGCPCASPDNQSPLCQNESGAYGQTQYSTGAQPSIRPLQVLEGLGQRGIVGSICAAPQPSPQPEPAHGYLASVKAIADRLTAELGKRCLSRSLAADGLRATCTIVEARRDVDCAAACAEPGRRPFDDEAFIASVREDPTAADATCFCEIEPLTGKAEELCQQDATPDAELPVDGWCYVDAEADPPIGNPELVAACAAGERRQIRLVGAAVSTTPLYISCGEGGCAL